jgi:hypothetical protein
LLPLLPVGSSPDITADLHRKVREMRRTWSNKSLQATRDDALSSASRFTLVDPACLSLVVGPNSMS